MADATNATNKKRTTRYTDDEMCKALTSFNGMVYLAAKHLGCAPSAIYRRMEKSARVREVVDNSRGELLDVAETALKAAVTAKEGWAVCFTLKTIGKNRGYVERSEWSGPDGGPIETRQQVFNHETAVATIAKRSDQNPNASGAD
jgi:hypothetical protein